MYALMMLGAEESVEAGLRLGKAGTLRLYEKWHSEGIAAVAATYATSAVKAVPAAERELVERCLSLAKDLRGYSRCLRPAFALQDYHERVKRWGGAASSHSHGWNRVRRRAKRQVTRLIEAQDPSYKAAAWAGPEEAPEASQGSSLSSIAAKLVSVGVAKFKERLALDAAESAEAAGEKMSRVAASLLETPPGGADWQSVYEGVRRYAQAKKWSDGYARLFDQSTHARGGVNSAEGKREKFMEDTRTAARDLFSLVTGRQQDVAEKITSPKIMSPKFLSVVPSDERPGVLSPNLLSFFRSKDSVAAIPDLLESFGTKERNEWMGVIMEASGATNAMRGILDDLDKASKNGTAKDDYNFVSTEDLERAFGPNYKEGLDFVRSLVGSLSLGQMDQLQQHGLAYMTDRQLDQVYGPGRRFHDALPVEVDIGEWKALKTKRQRDRAARRDLKALAYSDGFRLDERHIAGDNVSWAFSPETILLNSSFNRRLKQATVLSTSTGTTVLAPGVLGPFILTPGVLDPLILSPSALGSLILSPDVLGPDILSPFAISATILSPTVMNPYILTPYVLGPLVLAPEVMNPYILSPYALSPTVLTPGVMNPFILSPAVLSPVILGPQVMSPAILNPTALSPAIEANERRLCGYRLCGNYIYSTYDNDKTTARILVGGFSASESRHQLDDFFWTRIYPWGAGISRVDVPGKSKKVEWGGVARLGQTWPPGDRPSPDRRQLYVYRHPRLGLRLGPFHSKGGAFNSPMVLPLMPGYLYLCETRWRPPRSPSAKEAELEAMVNATGVPGDELALEIRKGRTSVQMCHSLCSKNLDCRSFYVEDGVGYCYLFNDEAYPAGPRPGQGYHLT